MQEQTRVLVAEDDSLVGEMVQGLLEDLRYRVIGKAVDGVQAVEMVQSLHPDIVLMDIEMPRMNGLEATRKIQKCCPTPVVVLTAYETPDLLQEASVAGVGAYLVKPPNKNQVERAIIVALARFEDTQELRRLNTELQERNQELNQALAQVKTLKGLLPICSNCKKIRDDRGYWQQVEIYIERFSEVEFSHGVCPDCMQKLYPDTYQKSVERRQDIIEVLVRLGQANLEAISSAVGLPESNTLNRLESMVTDGQIIYFEADGQALYKLP